MKIASISENKNLEKRVAVTPEIARKYISSGFELFLSENYAKHLGINDQQYKDLGVKFSNNEKDLITNSDIIIQLGCLSDDKLEILKGCFIDCCTKFLPIFSIIKPHVHKLKTSSLVSFL